MTVIHFENAPIRFINFSGRPVNNWPAGKRYFYIKLTSSEADMLDKQGFSVRTYHGEPHLCVHIDEEYDTPIAELDKLIRFEAEVFIEGRPINHVRNPEGTSAHLISITPKQ